MYKMNSIDDTLIVLREEIEEIFFKQFGDKSFNKTGKEIKNTLFKTGEDLFEILDKENAVNCILGQYIYYLDNHFNSLIRSFFKNERENTDIYQRLNQILNGNPLYFFYRFGFYCMILMSNEMQKTIFIEKKYDLFWDELFHLWERVNIEYQENEDEKINEMIKKLIEKDLVILPNFSSFFTGKMISKNIGRPSIITFNILLKFADLLEENRNDKKHTLIELCEMAAENKMGPTTIRNWLRNRLPHLHEPGKTIEELTKNNIIFLWNDYQKEKKGIKG